MSRDQDHGRLISDQTRRDVQAALLAEEDVHEDNVGLQGLDLTEGVGAWRTVIDFTVTFDPAAKTETGLSICE